MTISEMRTSSMEDCVLGASTDQRQLRRDFNKKLRLLEPHSSLEISRAMRSAKTLTSFVIE